MTKSKEDAVSPVIGVILMVAVTVILAAVIAAFVFGMGTSVQNTRVVGFTAAQNSSTNIVVTYQGGQDSASLSSVNVSVNGNLAATNWVPARVGAEQVVTGTTNPDTVTVTAKFNDGKEQVVLSTSV